MAAPVCSIMAIARNEGMFLVEWIAHHLSLGFDSIVIATNDCEDPTDALIDAIGARWTVHRIDNAAPMDDLTIQQRGNKRCLAHPAIAGSDWVLHIDIDEFLDLAPPAATVQEFIAPFAAHDAVAILWKLFGDGGRRHWDGGLVTDAFIHAEATPGIDTAHKTIFRPRSFAAASPHMPKEPTKPKKHLSVVNTEGAALPPNRHYRARGTSYDIDPALRTWSGAVINHYMLKSADLLTLKRHRGDAMGRSQAKRRPGSPEAEAFNRNDAIDRGIDRSRPGRVRLIDEMLSDPGIARLHSESRLWFEDRKRALVKQGIL